MKCIRKEIIMEMYYDGALVMPKNYAVVDEEEMTYVEGGYSREIVGFSSGSEAYNKLNQASKYAGAATFIVGAPFMGIGGALSSAMAAIVGFAGGIITGSCMWQWKQALDTAATVAKKYSLPVYAEIEVNHGTLSIGIFQAIVCG